ncbi:MAG: caspase family protein [Elusimicrobia bacterium]|nr:caspase family protein [Elusimicrobiota bacterium]
MPGPRGGLRAALAVFCLSWRAQAAGQASDPASAGPRPELTVQTGHQQCVVTLSVSPDGRLLATGSKDMTAKVWDLATGAELRTFKQSGVDLRLAGLMPDGKRLVTAGSDGAAKLWDVATGEELKAFQGPRRTLMSAGVSPDGRLLATADVEDTIRVLDLETGAELSAIRSRGWAFGPGSFSPDGKLLAVAGPGSAATLWDTSTGAQVRTFQGHAKSVVTAVISPDGRLLATGSYDKTAKLWDLASGALLKTFAGHGEGIDSLAFAPDGRTLVTGSNDNSAKLWDLATGAALKTIRTEMGPVMAAAFSPDGSRLVTSSCFALKLWRLSTGKEVRSFSHDWTAVRHLSVSPDGGFLAVVSMDGLTVWDLAAGRRLPSFPGDGRSAEPAEVIAGGAGMFVATPDSIKVYGLPPKEERRSIPGHSPFALSSDGKVLALTKNKEDAVVLWDVAASAPVRTFADTADSYYGRVALGPDGRFLATARSKEAGVKLWDALSGERLRTLEDGQWVSGMGFSPDGRTLATGNTEGTVKLWDVSSGVMARSFKAHPAAISLLTFSRDGARLATADREGAVKLWDPGTGSLTADLQGHADTMRALAFGPDGKKLFSGGADGTVRIWEAVSGKELCRVVRTNHGWVAVTPDGFFDGSREGVKSIRWTVGLESYPLEAFSEGYYVPGLLARVLAGAPLSAESLPGLSRGFAPPPRVRIVSPKDGSEPPGETAEVAVEVEDRGGGVDELRLYHNGKVVEGEGRDIKVTGPGSRASTRVFHVAMLEGENTLRAVALSRDRIEGNPDEVVVTRAGPAKRAVLHVLAVGINKYKNPALDLNYARADAQGLLDFFGSSGAGLFQDVRRAAVFDREATKAGILAGLESLKDAAPQDVVVVYLAGHGEGVGNAWYFVPHELTFPEREEELRANALSSADLQAAVAALGARKVLLLMDACKSGGALLAFAGRGFEERKALATLARAAGVHVVAASTQDQIAAEVKALGHGVFTHTLLEGLSGRADGSPKDGAVTVRELLSFVESRLPEVSQKYRAQAQYPVVDSRGMDFPISAVRGGPAPARAPTRRR